MFDLNNGWESIDNKTEEKTEGIARFIRPKDFDFCPIYCSSCNKAVSTVEDVDMMKRKGVCEECFTLFYYINAEKWNKG